MRWGDARWRAWCGLAVVGMLLLAGCGGHKNAGRVATGWSIRLGAGSTGKLSITSAPPSAERDRALTAVGGLADVDPSGVARIQLLGGRLGPSGAVVTRRLARPVSPNETATLMYFDTTRGVWQTVPSTLSADRLSVSARVHHFTDFAAGLLHFAGSLLGARASAPDCGKTPRPDWVDSAIYVDDQNAPLRVCVAGDSSNGRNVLIKVAVNRGYGMLIHTATKPTSSSIDLGDGPIDLLVDGVARIPALVELISGHDNGDLPAMAGQTATFTFSESQVRQVGGATALLTAELAPFEAAVGTIFDVIVGKVTGNAADLGVARAGAYVAAYATIAQCVGEILRPFSEGHWSSAISGAGKCFSDTAATVKALTARALRQAFPKTSTNTIEDVSSKAGRAVKALAYITLGLDATEWLNDHRLDAAGLQVHVFPKIKRTAATVKILTIAGPIAGGGHVAEEKPSEIKLFSGSGLRDLHWSTWGGVRAHATGSEWDTQKQTSPYTVVKSPVDVLATDPSPCGRTRVYRSLQVHFTMSVPPGMSQDATYSLSCPD